MVISPEIQNKIKYIDNLATLPSMATEILSLTRGSNASMRQIASVIEQDPSITTKILKISNSPLWGFGGKVDSVQRALVLLGLKQVTNIVIAVSLYSTFAHLKTNPYFDRDKFWMHSVGTAQIARSLAKKLGLNFQGEEFVAALIHDIGKMILDQYLPEKFQHVLEVAYTSGQPILQVEEQVLQCTHTEIGAWILSKWNFPESIQTGVQYHHHPDKAPQHQDLASVVHLSEILCELWGIGFDDDIKMVCLEEDPAWFILKKNHPNLYHLDLERFTFELNKEIEKGQLFIKLIQD